MAKEYQVDGMLLNVRHYIDKESKKRTVHDVLIYDDRNTFLEGAKVVAIVAREESDIIENAKLFEPVIVGMALFENMRDGTIKPSYRSIKRPDKAVK